MDNAEICGVLEIHVHHARNIHNICIYDNQDVYAKFSLTCNPDEALSTRTIHGGGKNPEFNQDLMLKITHLDAVLKCEIWMLSRARNLMEDQLLGFALVPISQMVGKGKVTHDYTLSSTDLFHSPAGTVQLTLSLDADERPVRIESATSSSISSEVVLLDRQISHIEYSKIEFPDIHVVSENQKMVSEYFSSKRPGLASFLHLGASPPPPPLVDHDCEMAANSSVEENGLTLLSSITTSLSDDSQPLGGELSDSNANTNDGNQRQGVSPETPSSSKGSSEGSNKNKAVFTDQFTAEQSAMQKQIVEMYMRSMQQFTESLAQMKLPMDVDKQELGEDCGDVIQSQNNSNKLEVEKKKKEGSRVFYGSRAFF